MLSDIIRRNGLVQAMTAVAYAVGDKQDSPYPQYYCAQFQREPDLYIGGIYNVGTLEDITSWLEGKLSAK